MDSDCFDRLATTLSGGGTRRTLLHMLAALPLGVALPSVLGAVLETAAADDDHGSSHRRQRRKAEHRHQTGKDKDNRNGQRTGKGKGKKKGTPPAKPDQLPPPPTRTVVTRTFANTTPITILTDPSFGAEVATPASPYPSLIEVAGLANGRILDINLTLHGLSHWWPSDIDILLAAAHLPGLNAFVMSDTADRTSVGDRTLTLDDQAASELPPADILANGTFRPTNHDNFGTEEFPAPAPVPSGNVALSVFTGSDPNGTWQLFVVDDTGTDDGSIANGWSLEITAEVDT